MHDMGARDRFVAACAALALRRGGLEACRDSLTVLARVSDALPLLIAGDPLAALMGPVGDVLSAVQYADEAAFSLARWDLQTRLTEYFDLWAWPSGAFCEGRK